MVIKVYCQTGTPLSCSGGRIQVLLRDSQLYLDKVKHKNLLILLRWNARIDILGRGCTGNQEVWWVRKHAMWGRKRVGGFCSYGG
jgi:hypothetical protein